jgi:hypothetical protein
MSCRIKVWYIAGEPGIIVISPWPPILTMRIRGNDNAYLSGLRNCFVKSREPNFLRHGSL